MKQYKVYIHVSPPEQNESQWITVKAKSRQDAKEKAEIKFGMIHREVDEWEAGEVKN
jgi:hypothetical protein